MEDPTQPPAPLTNGNHGGPKDPENGTNYGVNLQVHGQILHNGGTPSMPPQQVYINNGMPPPDMVGLENQLRTMSMGHPSEQPRGPEEGLNDEYDDDGDNDEETSDEDPLKLFVGQVRHKLCSFV